MTGLHPEPAVTEDWLRSATVTGAGAPLQHTLLFDAQWLARHERTHIRQIRKTVTAVSGY